MTSETFPWLIFPPAVDLANTVMITATGARDLLETQEQLEEWIEAEFGRIDGVEAAARRLADVHELRDTVYELLHARARGKPPPKAARERVNAISASATISKELTRDGRAVEKTNAAGPYASFEAAIARSAIELADRDLKRLSVCGAPSCGMLFLRDHPRQVWCTKECGNRARVARYAARQRRGSG